MGQLVAENLVNTGEQPNSQYLNNLSRLSLLPKLSLFFKIKHILNYFVKDETNVLGYFELRKTGRNFLSVKMFFM